jgi:hypothetical protein
MFKMKLAERLRSRSRLSNWPKSVLDVRPNMNERTSMPLNKS